MTCGMQRMKRWIGATYNPLLLYVDAAQISPKNDFMKLFLDMKDQGVFN